MERTFQANARSTCGHELMSSMRQRRLLRISATLHVRPTLSSKRRVLKVVVSQARLLTAFTGHPVEIHKCDTNVGSNKFPVKRKT